MRTPSSARDVSRTWLTAVALYFLAAASTIHLTSNGRDIAAFWPANAILVALLLADGRPHWKTVLSAGFIGNIAANLVTRGSFIGPVLYGVANMLEVALVVALVRDHRCQDGILQSNLSLLRFLLVAGLFAPAASGVLGATTANLLFGEAFAQSFVDWLASDALGLLVFTPFFFAVFRGDFVVCFNSRSWLRRFEGIAILGMTGAVSYFVFFLAKQPMLFMLFPPLMLVTFRIGGIGTTAAVMLVAIVGSIATIHGYGPVIKLSPIPSDQAHLLQAFLAVLLLTCLPVAAEVTARARLTDRLDAYNREMTNQAMTDPLTGVCNRAGFESAAGISLATAQGRSDSLITIDIDYFKTINDRWGHQVGDRALRHISDILKANTRPLDVIGRLGGDEFAVLLPHSDTEAAIAVAERFQASLRATPFEPDYNATMLVGMSMGIASSRPGEDYAQLHKRADLALYAAKNAGRNRISKAAV